MRPQQEQQQPQKASIQTPQISQHPQTKQSTTGPILVQVGDAQRHMINDMTKQTQNKGQEAFDLSEMNRALSQQEYEQQMRQYQYWQQQQQYFQQYQHQEGYQQPQNQYNHQPELWEERGRGRGHWRGRGKGRNKEYGPPPPFVRAHFHQQQHHQWPQHCVGQYHNPPYQHYNSQPCHYDNWHGYQGQYQQCQTYTENARVQAVQKQENIVEYSPEQKPQIPLKHKHSKNRRCGRKRSDSSSSQDSQSDDQKRQKQRQHQKQEKQLTQFYQNQIGPFLDIRKVKQRQKQRIIRLFKDRHPQFAQCMQYIRNYIIYLESLNIIYHLGYFRVIKVMIKHNFIEEPIVSRLSMMQEKRVRRIQADQKFKKDYGEDSLEPMLNHHDLLEMDQENIYFLIDGNNIMPTSKHFKHYFKSFTPIEKVQAQLRLKMLVSLAFDQNYTLFFDEKYNQEDYLALQQALIPTQEEKDRINNVPTIYGEDQIADEKIIQKCQELSKKGFKKQIILVSSDRQLFMKCNQKLQVKRTGGRFFFKYLGKTARQKCKKNKDRKKVLDIILKKH